MNAGRSTEMGRLDGKVALIVGASPNNGGTTAHFMAREGATIIANDLVPEAGEETANFIRSRGYEAIAFAGDASDPEQVQSVVNQAVEHYGEAHVGEVGMFHPPYEGYSVEEAVDR